MKPLSSYQSLRQSIRVRPFIKPKFSIHSQVLASRHIVNYISPRHILSLLFKLTSLNGVFSGNIILPQVVKKNFRVFMESECLSPHWQRPTICPWPDPDQSVPVLQIFFFTIHFNIILPFTAGSQMVSFSRVSPPKPYMNLSVPHTCYIQRPPYSPWIWSPEYVIFGDEYKLWSSHCSSLSMRDQVSHPHTTTGKALVPYITIFMFWIANWKTKDSGSNDNRHSLSTVCS